LQDVFVHDWHYTTRQALTDRRYFPRPTHAGDHVVQLVPSGPDLPAPVMHQLLFAAVSAATLLDPHHHPYFVPDTAMILALQSAALRGVSVQLLIPTCSDHRIVLWAGRSFYPELTQAGVEIYEHDETMLHSKVVIVDQTWAMVGSANMDERSFRINFELTPSSKPRVGRGTPPRFRDPDHPLAACPHLRRRQTLCHPLDCPRLARLASPLL
jgi:cardiolipin synthase